MLLDYISPYQGTLSRSDADKLPLYDINNTNVNWEMMK